MVDISAITGAITALKSANDIAQAMVGLRDAAAFQSKLIEFQNKIIEANASAFAAQDERAELLRKIADLDKQVEKLTAEKRKFDRYQLKDFGGNSFAYELKASEANGEPIHRACATCFQDERISILQFSHQSEGQDWYTCPRCKEPQHFGAHVRRESYRSHHSDF
ncbi:hypothetical protein E4K64_33330 [Bradyrhizobium frederickii]|uniref:Uncharacterized protein n=1 Tax=Bradyrhizobium frederickii TaxID=2560054 RepID=A0A4Y9NR08_9BRAD|nr:hypothetical protein [Bradyrhizobium frederickii]TFV69416.1 hypothetical protein E4K64_33330 [Bradyrhizobium frederickii]